MHGVKVSRWSLSYFAVAVVSLLLAELLLALGIADPLGALTGGWTLTAVHLTTLGWATWLMLGALQQFVPVLIQQELASQTAAGVTLAAGTLGLAALLAGFLSLPGGIGWPLTWALPWGGTLVVLAALVALINLGITLFRARPWTASMSFIATGLGFFLLTILLGLTFALALASPGEAWAPVLEHGLAGHLWGGLVGWLTLTAMGVAYKLLAMFTLAPEERGWWPWVAYTLTAAGVTALWLSPWLPGWPLALGGWVAGTLGIATFLVDLIRLYAQRKRRSLELNARMARFALAALGLAVLSAVALRLRLLPPTLWPAVIFYWLYGWIGGLGLSQLYKIVPFLTWIERYGKKLGRTAVPRVQDLVRESRDEPAFWAYAAAALAASLALAAQAGLAFRLAAALLFLATLDIARGLLRVRIPVRASKTPPPPAEPKTLPRRRTQP
ncbi:MAG: hypothetical protein K6U87_07490 [Firmicutes bacterium]|nr:hypothetical protein [Bacillota bacterium]